MIEIIAIVDHPGGVFALGGQELVVGECRQGPETAVEELIQGRAAGQVEGIDGIGADEAGIALDNELCCGAQVGTRSWLRKMRG